MDMSKPSDQELKTSYTAGEIFGLMARGAFYAAAVLIGIAGFVIVFYVIGRLLPPEEAYFSALDTAVRVLA